MDKVGARCRHVDYGFQIAASNIYGKEGHECFIRILKEFYFQRSV
jgi:hypothetical protein